MFSSILIPVLLAIVITWLWLAVISIMNNQFIWSVVILLLPPLCVLYGLFNMEQAGLPTKIMMVSLAILIIHPCT